MNKEWGKETGTGREIRTSGEEGLNQISYKNSSEFFGKSSEPFFENLPELLRPSVAASALGLSVKTIYNWHYRKTLKEIPPSLFLKIDRMLYLRRDTLRKWIASMNA